MKITKSKKRMAIIMCYPHIPAVDDPDQVARMTWLEKYMPVGQIKFHCRPDLGMIEAWDDAVKSLVFPAPEHITEIVFMHDDVVPITEADRDDQTSDMLFRWNGPIVCCRFDAYDKPWLFSKRLEFHNPLCRIRREVFEVVPPSWWDWRRHIDTGKPTQCGCRHFSLKSWLYDYESVNTGVCIHRERRMWCDGKKEAKTKNDPPASVDLASWKRDRAIRKNRKANRKRALKKFKRDGKFIPPPIDYLKLKGHEK